MTKTSRLLVSWIQDGNTKAAREIASLVRSGQKFTEAEQEAIAQRMGWDDGVGHPDDIAYIVELMRGLLPDASEEQRERLASEIEDDADYDEAIRAARNGNPTRLMERQRQGKAASFPPTAKRGRKPYLGVVAEAYAWLTEVEGMSRKSAIDKIREVENKNRTWRAVEQEVDKTEFKPHFWFEIRAQKWRSGERGDELRPAMLRDK